MTAELAALVEEIKARLSVGRDPDDPVTNGEVAEHLPEDRRSEFWRTALDKFFAAELAEIRDGSAGSAT